MAKQRFQVPGIAITRNRWPEEKEADYFCIDGFAASVLASFSRPGKRICFIHAYIITFANRFRFPSNYYFAKDDSKRIVEQRFLRQELKKGKRNTEKNHITHKYSSFIVFVKFLIFNFVIIYLLCISFLRFPSLEKRKKKKKKETFSDI